MLQTARGRHSSGGRARAMAPRRGHGRQRHKMTRFLTGSLAGSGQGLRCQGCADFFNRRRWDRGAHRGMLPGGRASRWLPSCSGRAGGIVRGEGLRGLASERAGVGGAYAVFTPRLTPACRARFAGAVIGRYPERDGFGRRAQRVFLPRCRALIPWYLLCCHTGLHASLHNAHGVGNISIRQLT